MTRPSNDEIAHVLERIAELLAAQAAQPFRVRAYREAARTVRRQPTAVANLALDREHGALEQLPTIGDSIASTIREYAARGRSGLLDRLEGQVSPEDLFASLPGIGEDLAHRLHHQLQIDTLEELEQAAHDGRLEDVSGFGPRRTEALRHILADVLSRSARRRARLVDTPGLEQAERPAVDLLLEVDAEYRRQAAAGTLRTIAPRRFNPEHLAWLPILHTERGGWDFTALFSNTARAHALGTTRDWVIVYYERNGDEGQATVVTERRGRLAGRRVVRGREDECFPSADMREHA